MFSWYRKDTCQRSWKLADDTSCLYTTKRSAFAKRTALWRKHTLPSRKPYGITSHKKTSFLHNNNTLHTALHIPTVLMIWEEGGPVTSWRRVRIVYCLSVKGSLMAQDVHTVNTLNLCTHGSRNTRTMPRRCENILWQPLTLGRLGKTLVADLLFNGQQRWNFLRYQNMEPPDERPNRRCLC